MWRQFNLQDFLSIRLYHFFHLSYQFKPLAFLVVLFSPTQFDDNVYQARRNAHKAIEMCVHMSPGTEGVVDAKLVPVLVAKLLNEEDEIKVFKFFACKKCAYPSHDRLLIHGISQESLF